MNKICTPLLIGMISILFSSGCNPKHTSPKERNEVAIGETFQIRIKENPSTGYQTCWMNKEDALAVSLVKKEYKQEGSSDCAGCGGTATYTFKGIAPGTDTIMLANCRGVRADETCDGCAANEGQVNKFIATVK